MARTLSSIAHIGTLIVAAAAAAMTARFAHAQSVPPAPASPASQVVDNPFAPRAAQASPTTQPAPVVVPLSSDNGPKVFQNPFAASYASPPPASVRPRGSLSRWRQPVPLPAVTDANPFAAKAAADPQSSGPSWDQLSPTDLPSGPSAGTSLPDDRPAASPQNPPDPQRFSTSKLQQPVWLDPEASESSDATQTSSDGAAGLSHNLRSAGALMHAAPAAAPPTVAVAKASPEPADPTDANQWCDVAKQAAAAAKTPDDFANVINDCRQGIRCQPPRETVASLRSLAAWACNRRGELKSESGRDDEAIQEFEAALAWDPNCWLAIHNRAVSRAEQGQTDAALADFNRVVELNPGLAVAYRNRGELLASLGRTEEAVADYGRAIEQLPQDADLRMMRGDARHRLGQYPEALKDLNRSIELAPQHSDALTQRGNVFAEVGDFERAARDFREALRIDPNCTEAYRSVAWLFATCPDARYRNPQKAVFAANQAAKLAPPNDPFVLDALAAANAAAGQFDQAVRYQSEAVTFAPDGFSDQFAARLALYQQHRPFRNAVPAAQAQPRVQQAALQAPASGPRAARTR